MVAASAEATDDGSLWGFGFIDLPAGSFNGSSYAITCGDVIFASGFESSSN